MALGIGANTAVFSFVSALLLRPLPFPEAHRLIRIDSLRGNETGKITPREWEELDRDSKVFEGVAAWYPSQYNLSYAGSAEVLTACMTTANLFRVLGVKFAAGASWKEGTHRDRNPVVVLNHELWQRRFGGDRSLVGKTLPLDFSSYEVLGVAEPGFDFPGKMDIFRAAYLGSAQNWEVRSLFAVARLQKGVSIEQARQRLSEFGFRMEREFPKSNRGVTFQVRTLRDAYVGEVRPYVLLALGLASLVLLMACVNVVNLLVARGLARRREQAVRTALGASAARIVRQAVAESLLVCLAGGMAGMAAAYWWAGVIRQWIRVDLPSWMTAEVDYRVLLFALVVSALCGIAGGVFPALAMLRMDLNSALRDSGRGSSGGRGSARLRGALVTTELALAALLLVMSGLLVKSFWKLQETDTGFRRAPALTLRTDPPWSRYNKAEQTALFYRQVIDQLGEIPGVTGVAANHSMPLALNQNYGRPAIVVEGQSVDDLERSPFVNVQIVSASYFAVMGVPLREGRGFTSDDRIGTTPVAVISRPLARRLFREASAVGRRVQLPGLLTGLNETKPAWLQIVGVAEGVRSEALTAEPSLDIYLSNQQQFAGDTFFVLRTAKDPMALAPAVSRAIQQVGPEQPVFDIRPLAERIDDTVWQRRIAGTLSLCFGALALLLAAVGVYGVLSYLVSQRTREIGIRQALGSPRSAVWWLVVRDGLTLAGGGLLIGITAALGVAQFLEGFLYRVSAYDPAVLLTAIAATTVTSLAACAVPAWRATRVNPMEALRSE